MTKWIPVAEQLPDDDVTVVIAQADDVSAPVWLGYLDGDEWFDIEGMRCEPTHWMELPTGP